MKNESVSVANMEVREVNIVHFSRLNSEILFPERLIVEVGVSKIDIGCICYSRREDLAVDKRLGANQIKLVDVSTLRNDRKDLVRNLIDYIVVGAYREATIATKFKTIIHLMNWIDLNGFSDFLLGQKSATEFYSAYFDHLKNRVLTSDELVPRSAAGKQQIAETFIKIAFGTEAARYIVRKTPRFSSKIGRDLAFADEKSVRQYTHVVLILAKQLSTQLMQEKPFPFLLEFNDFSAYVFHGRGKNVRTPFTKDVSELYNFDEGRVVTADELMERVSGLKMREAALQIKSCLKNLDLNNRVNTDARLRYATLALQCYAALFQMITAANPTQLVALEFDEAFEVANNNMKKELSSVKFRAGGKLVRYTIGKRGIRLLKEYLAFRSWALGGADFKYLFFEYERFGGYSNKPKSLKPDFQHSFFHRRLKGIFLPDNFKNITFSLARSYKSVVLHELGVNPKVVADSLQHTVRVNHRSYVNVSPKVSSKEFGRYWAAVAAAAKDYRIVDRDALNITATASGECDDFGNPKPISSAVPIQPDCEKQYGCLYCKHYCCHADEEDVHKLLSLKYVLSEVRRSAKNIDHADDVLRELCVRAALVVDSIRARSDTHSDMVEKVEKTVFELGILTRFWEIRLTRYERLGVVV